MMHLLRFDMNPRYYQPARGIHPYRAYDGKVRGIRAAWGMHRVIWIWRLVP